MFDEGSAHVIKAMIRNKKISETKWYQFRLRRKLRNELVAEIDKAVEKSSRKC